MSKHLFFTFCRTLAAAVAIGAPACDQHRPPKADPCAQAVARNEWCDAKNVGFVAGVSIRSRLLFDALDAHGHDLVHDAIACPACRAAIPTGGYCDKCRIGWVDGQAYFSRLTYHMARGRLVADADLACPACRKNRDLPGWCGACQRGIVGNVAFMDRGDFAGAKSGFERMLLAIDASARCETCALAILADTSCFFCKITYHDGRPIAQANN